MFGIVLTDGKATNCSPPPRDYKEMSEGDAGLSTGGMGAVSPALCRCHLYAREWRDGL